jgi:hypothetical protein
VSPTFKNPVSQELVGRTGGWGNEKRGDWFDNQPKEERDMDEYNNDVGRQCAAGTKNNADCQNRCYNAAMNGSLRTLGPGGTGMGYWEREW